MQKKSGPHSGPDLQLFNQFFETFACLKCRNVSGRDFNLLASAGIAADLSCPLPLFKGAKANDLDFFAFGDSSHNAIQNRVYSLFTVFFGEASLLSNQLNEISLVHDITSLVYWK